MRGLRLELGCYGHVLKILLHLPNIGAVCHLCRCRLIDQAQSDINKDMLGALSSVKRSQAFEVALAVRCVKLAHLINLIPPPVPAPGWVAAVRAEMSSH